MTKAEQLINATTQEIKEKAMRKEYLDWAVEYTFDDGSAIQIRKLSGRSAFAKSGQHIKTI